MICRILLASLSAILATFPARAGPNICWIAQVVSEGSAVRVLFSSSGYNIVGANKSQGQFVIGYNEITWLAGPKERTTEPGLLLMQNESAALIQGVEDTCMITFAEMGGRKGITAHASFSVPPAPPTEDTVFIPSESLTLHHP
jgi:hypothetical protein